MKREDDNMGKNNLNISEFKFVFVVTKSLRRLKMPRFLDHEPVTSSARA